MPPTPSQSNDGHANASRPSSPNQVLGSPQVPLPSSLTNAAPSSSINANAYNTDRHSNSYSYTTGSPRSPLTLHKPAGDSTPSGLMHPAHQAAHPVHTSSTHAGGVLPSASFFRPARPDQQQRYSQPESLYSASHEVHNIAPESDAFPLGSLSKRHSTSSSDGPPASIGDPESNVGHQNASQNSPLKRVKPSRELLLPIGGKVSAFCP